MSDTPIENLAVGWLPGVNVPAHPPDAVSGAATPICQRCNGTGTEPGHQLWNCRRCKGTGVVAAEPAATPEAQIPECVHAPKILDYWRCFHCDFHTPNREEAEAHFGDRDDAEEFKPICKWWSNMDESERRETLQDTIRDLRREQEENASLESQLAALRVERDRAWNEAKEALDLLRSARDAFQINSTLNAEMFVHSAIRSLARPIPAEPGEEL